MKLNVPRNHKGLFKSCKACIPCSLVDNPYKNTSCGPWNEFISKGKVEAKTRQPKTLRF